MSDRLQTIIITVVLFVSGLLIGVWTQRSRAIPPPIPLMGEFRGPSVLGEFPHHHSHHWEREEFFGKGHMSPEEMRTRLAEMQPRIKAFQANLANIESEFRKGFDAILTPAQKSKLDQIIAGHHHRRFGDGPMPGCAGELGTPLIPIVIYRPLLDRMTQMLTLSSAQHDQLETLLVERRTRFLKFVDDNPPPSFHLRDMMGRGSAPSGAATVDGSPPAAPEQPATD